MFGEVTLQAEPREGLSIPADAVIDSGPARWSSWRSEGEVPAREVRVGASGGDAVEVISGLHGRRDGGDPRQLPHPTRSPAARLPGGDAGGGAMIQARHPLLGGDRFLVIAGVLVLLALSVHACGTSAGRAPGPLRHAGDRLLRWTEPGHHRGPGHLPVTRLCSGPAGEGHPRVSPNSAFSFVYVISRTAPIPTGPRTASSVPLQDHPRSSRRG